MWFMVVTRQNDGHVHTVQATNCKDRAIKYAQEAHGGTPEERKSLAETLAAYGECATESTMFSVCGADNF